MTRCYNMIMQTVRTTIRIRKDLYDQSRLLAFKKGSSFQEVINDTLALGFGKISDLKSTEEAMKEIDAFRESLSGSNIRAEDLVELSKRDRK